MLNFNTFLITRPILDHKLSLAKVLEELKHSLKGNPLGMTLEAIFRSQDVSR